jgi:mRNA interferase HigB
MKKFNFLGGLANSQPFPSFEYYRVMNVLSRNALVQFYSQHNDAKKYLETWFKTCRKADWSSFRDLQRTFPEAFPVGDDRVVFDIRGNKYRMVVRIVFRYRTMQIKWIGTHAQYNEIDVIQINEY